MVFHAEELHDGGLTTHRVVDETDAGYITKGDANPFTDQDGGEPPVTDDQIVATVLQVNGEVVAIPWVGTAIMTVQNAVLAGQDRAAAALGTGALLSTQGVGLLLFFLGLVLFAASLVGELGQSHARDRSRDRRSNAVDSRYVVIALLLLVLLPANLAMVAPSGSSTVTIDGDTVADAGITPGEQIDHEFTASNDGFVAMVVVVETPTEGASVTPTTLELPGGTSTTATLSVAAPAPDAQQTVTVTQHRYFLILPPSVVATLHGIHPVVAWGVINLLLAVSVLGIAGGVLGFGRIHLRETSRSYPLGIRLRRLFR